jgi:hypothetical protein
MENASSPCFIETYCAGGHMRICSLLSVGQPQDLPVHNLQVTRFDDEAGDGARSAIAADMDHMLWTA